MLRTPHCFFYMHFKNVFISPEKLNVDGTSMLNAMFLLSITPKRHSALSRSTWRPFGPERLDMSRSALSSQPKGSSTCLTAEGLSTGYRTSEAGNPCSRYSILEPLVVHWPWAEVWFLFPTIQGA